MTWEEISERQMEIIQRQQVAVDNLVETTDRLVDLVVKLSALNKIDKETEKGIDTIKDIEERIIVAQSQQVIGSLPWSKLKEKLEKSHASKIQVHETSDEPIYNRETD